MPEPVSRECNVVMKGGITSGVVYPRALAEFARTYRLRSLGGASAGAIGAAFGAAAEHGRGRPGAGFELLDAVPAELGEGRLAALFQPAPDTRPLLPLLLALTGHDAPGAARAGAARASAVGGALVRGFPVPAVLALVAALALAAPALLPGQGAGWVVAGLAVGLIVLVAGWAAAVLRVLGHAVPAHQFGICTGLGSRGRPGFTDWLAERLDALAGRGGAGPLLFGHLWTGTDAAEPRPIRERAVDLRTMSTCLTQGRPYEMPWEARGFFYEPAVWRTLFPAAVVDALEAAGAAVPPDGGDPEEWRWEDARAAAHPRGLRRLPEPHLLPVIVAVRLSLSFPLLISAVPLWTIDRRSPATSDAVRAFRAGGEAADATPAFVPVWFTDGGFTSNFPVHLFDEALPTRPTFAINLGDFLPGRAPSPDQSRNVEYARGNRALLPSHRPLPEDGLGALVGFVSAALATSREWSDAAQLTAPGMRDRVVRVLQSGSEGGLNLFMDAATIDALAERGRAAASGLVDMFTQPHYGRGAGGEPVATGWDNHRWVRYRALLGALPTWYASYAAGAAALAEVDPDRVGSYPLTARDAAVADRLHALHLEAAALLADPQNAAAVAHVEAEPRPATVLRRVPVV